MGKNAIRVRRICKLSRRIESTGSAVIVSIVYALIFEDSSILSFLFSSNIGFSRLEANRDKKDIVKVKA